MIIATKKGEYYRWTFYYL